MRRLDVNMSEMKMEGPHNEGPHNEGAHNVQLTLVLMILLSSLNGVNLLCHVSPPTCLCTTGHQTSDLKQITCADERSIKTTEIDGMLHPRYSRAVKGSSRHNEVLDKVSLIYAGITGIRGGAFAKVQIVHLDLQGNNFQDHISPKAFSGVGRYLRSLNMAWSNITELNMKVFRGMIPLRNLSLAENQLRDLPGTIFHHLRSLRRLSLAGNPISQLSGTIFRYLTTLEVLDVGYCQLKRLPWTIFMGLWNLRVLDLRGNRLAYLEPFMFMDLTYLHTLLLGNNPIRRLPTDVFHGLQHLIVLRLDESNIEIIAYDVFRDLKRLLILNLADNAIDYIIPGTLSLPSLETLSLDGNKLKEFPMDVRLMPRLRSLDVSYNDITTLDVCLYRYLRHLDFFNLQENRLVCDCSLLWLKALRVEMQRKWRHKSDIHRRRGPLLPGRCAAPQSLSYVGATSWVDLDCLREYNNQLSLHSGINITGWRPTQDKVTSHVRYSDQCDGPSGQYDSRIESRRRHIRHLAYLSRDLHYMYRPKT